MSGTSADGIDAALLDFALDGPGTLLGHWHFPYPASLQSEIFRVQERLDLGQVARLDRILGKLHGQAAASVMEEAGKASCVAMHGQTVFHRPGGPEGSTLQIGCAADVALATSCTIIHDFRRADVAAGGQGAPLVPPYHQACFAHDQPVWILNLGGVANITWVPPKGSDSPLQAFDTGPGNVLLDAAVSLLSGGKLRMDPDGSWASRGRTNRQVLASWLQMDFFRAPPPKSTGREQFQGAMVQDLWQSWKGSPDDFLATLTVLTAESVAHGARTWTPGASRMLVFGGGAKNLSLLRAIQEALPGILVEVGEHSQAIPSQALEAMAFSWLGGQCLLGKALGLASVTGQKQPVVLGHILPGPDWADLNARIREMLAGMAEP